MLYFFTVHLQPLLLAIFVDIGILTIKPSQFYFYFIEAMSIAVTTLVYDLPAALPFLSSLGFYFIVFRCPINRAILVLYSPPAPSSLRSFATPRGSLSHGNRRLSLSLLFCCPSVMPSFIFVIIGTL